MMTTPGKLYSKTPKRTPMRRERPPPMDVDPVEVYCRVRPLDPDDEETCVEILSEDTIQLNPPKLSRAISKIEKMECTFKRVFTENDSQKNIFVQVGLPLVEDLLNGKSSLLFMYGITGSGKTHTMNGSPSNPGVLPRCLDVLFNSISDWQTERGVFRSDARNGYELLSDSESKQEKDKKEKELKSRHYKDLRKGNEMADVIRVPDSTTLQVDEDRGYAVFISYVEIYNNFIYDLLDENQDAITKAPVSRSLREDADKNTYVAGATEVEVKTTEEAYDVFWNGQKRRRVAHTLLNAESSRSHSVFSVKLVQVPLDSSGEHIIQEKRYMSVSQLSLCDLAGSERTKRTDNGGDRLKEAGNINNSLMTLRNCIEALRENQKATEAGNRLQIVPYRESKLTHLFKRHFEGEGKVRMIVCLNPKPGDFDESLHVMRFSEVTQEVKVARSEGAKFELGLTPGRGKAHRLYKDVRDELEQVKTEFAETEVIRLKPLQRFDAFPCLEMASAEDGRTLYNLISYLQQRISLRNTLLTEQGKKEEHLRSQLMSLQQENEDFCRALADQKTAYTDKDREIQNLEKRIKNLNQKMMTVQTTVTRLEKDKREVETEVERYKKAYEREKHEKHKVEKTLRHLTSSERSKWEMECNKRVKNKELEMQERYFKKAERLEQVKDIIDNFDSPVRTVHVDIPIDNEEAPAYVPPEPKPTPGKYHHRVVKEKVPPPVAKKPIRIKPKTPSTERVQRSKSPPATSRKPDRREAPMRARHRRSRSSDCILVHKPTDTLETDTIMQPMIRNKKTVAIPKISDLKHELHYLLEHQEEDSAGEIETKLFKGSVMKTRTGGHSVQFTDVESLKHRSEGGVTTTAPSGTDTDVSPRRKGRKRQSSASEAVSDDSLTSVEGRCAVGVGGGPYGEPAQEAKRKKH